ncbi:MAG TPA: DUF6152 family protein [Gammaproteobacteria bacterium]
MKTIGAIVACAGLLAASASSWAHHSFASEFDVDRPVRLEGKITKVEWVNPHSWFYLEVQGEDGKPVVWMIEGGSPNALIRRGVTAQTVPAGTELMVEGYQARDGSNTAVGRSFLLGNGERLFLGGSAENVPAPQQE